MHHSVFLIYLQLARHAMMDKHQADIVTGMLDKCSAYWLHIVTPEQVLRQFFKDPEWNAGYDDSIPETLEALEELLDNGTLWGGSDIRRIARLHPILLKKNGAWELCLDWIRPFKSIAYSVGVLGIR